MIIKPQSATPLLTDDNTEKVQPGSVFGLVKWNANDWIGLAMRPEFVRRQVVGCGTAACTSAQMRVSLGVEVGRVPGLAMTVASSILGGLTAIAVAAGGGK